MDYKNFVDFFNPMTVVLSVEKKPDGSYGKICMVDGNQAYIDSISLARGNSELKGEENPNIFVPGSEYTRYIPKDMNFENTVYKCAVQKEPMHIFTHPERYNFGMNIFMLPLEDEDDERAFCTFTQVLVPIEESVGLSSTISREMAQEILDICVKLRSTNNFESVMKEIIEDLRLSYDAKLTCIMLMDDNNRSCSVLCESLDPDTYFSPVSDLMNDDFYALAETWKDTLGGSTCIMAQTEQEWEFLKEKNPDWYQSLKENNVSSIVLFPLISRNHFLGYIWAVDFSQETSEKLRDSLELITYFIASEIASYKFVEKLRVLSEIDVLTGVLNRNEMNNLIIALCEEPGYALKGIGVVFADMNGLKYVNDNQGHDAGDTLLRNASMILQSAFSDSEIFRAGGDEFMILMKDTTTEVMEERIAEIKSKSSMFENVSFAAGYCLLEGKPDDDIRSALKIADVAMYEDKALYYKEHPEFARN